MAVFLNEKILKEQNMKKRVKSKESVCLDAQLLSRQEGAVISRDDRECEIGYQ